MDIWPVIWAERKALAADLKELDEDQWSMPSMCSQWTVCDVVAHMTATAKITSAAFFPKLAGPEGRGAYHRRGWRSVSPGA